MTISISTQINNIVEEYIDQEKEKIDAITNEVAKDTVKDLKETSPKSEHGRKHYANRWRVKKEKQTSGGVLYIVHNVDKYQLTHLLEHGHAKVNGSRVAAIPHIEPAKERAEKEYLRKLEAEL